MSTTKRSTKKRRKAKGPVPDVAGIPGTGKAIPAPTAFDREVTFSLKHANLNHEKFRLSVCVNEYFLQLFERLIHYCGLKVGEILTNRSSTLRAHPIDFADTSEPGGFGVTAAMDVNPYQLSLTANKYGRLHGFFIGATFYIVWFDHAHQLYPDDK